MKKNTLFSLLALVALWLGWLIAYFAVRNEYVLPSFSMTLKECCRLFADGGFWLAFASTFLRTFIAFLLSFVFGAGCAALTLVSKNVRAFCAPIISVLRTVPTMAIILILILWTSPAVAPVIVTFLVLFPAVYSACLASFDGIEEEYGTLVRSYGVSKKKQIVKMYLPLSAPAVLKQSGGLFSMGLKITISGEVLSNTFHSLGGALQEAKMFLEMPRLIALTLLAVVLGFALEGAVALLVRVLGRKS